MKWENQWGNFPRSSPVSVDVFDVSGLRRKRNIQVRESAYSTRLFPTLSSINPKEYGRTCETASKSGKQIERSVISTFRIAWSIGWDTSELFNGARGTRPAQRLRLKSLMR